MACGDTVGAAAKSAAANSSAEPESVLGKGPLNKVQGLGPQTVQGCQLLAWNPGEAPER